MNTTKSLKTCLINHAEALLSIAGKVEHSRMIDYKNALVEEAFKLGHDVKKQADVALFQVERSYNIKVDC